MYINYTSVFSHPYFNNSGQIIDIQQILKFGISFCNRCTNVYMCTSLYHNKVRLFNLVSSISYISSKEIFTLMFLISLKIVFSIKALILIYYRKLMLIFVSQNLLYSYESFALLVISFSGKST